ncbi:MAG: hypothetical protein AB1938_06895 [Myxococcota bacterium]
MEPFVPPLDDARWRALVTSPTPPRFSQLVTQILFTRARVLAANEATIDQAVRLVHDYFARADAAATREDLHIALREIR